MLAYDVPEDYTRDSGLVGGVMSRVDFEYARNLIGRVHSENETRWWDPDGWCALPKHEPYVRHSVNGMPTVMLTRAYHV